MNIISIIIIVAAVILSPCIAVYLKRRRVYFEKKENYSKAKNFSKGKGFKMRGIK